MEKNKLISVLEANEFNHPIKYAATKNGLAFLEQNLNPKLLIAHINKMNNPDFMLKLVKAILQSK